MNTGLPQIAPDVRATPAPPQDEAVAGSCKPKSRSKGHSIQPIPVAPTTFSTLEAFDLFRESRKKTFVSFDISIETVNEAIVKEWKAAGFEERSTYFRKAWLNYEKELDKYHQMMSKRKVLPPEYKLEQEKPDLEIPIGSYIAPDIDKEDTRLLQVKEHYKDDDICVVEKPAGLACMSSDPAQDNVLDRIKAGHPGASLPHRLDKATSGVMVVSLKSDSARDLCAQFKNRQVHKKYTAEVWGKPEPLEGPVLIPLKYDDAHRRQCISERKGKPSLSLYQSIKNHRDGFTRVKLEPVTGRSHQLRAHMAAIGHPILGCKLYGSKESATASKRLHLHASELEFKHPVTGRAMKYESTPDF